MDDAANANPDASAGGDGGDDDVSSCPSGLGRRLTRQVPTRLSALPCRVFYL